VVLSFYTSHLVVLYTRIRNNHSLNFIG
jgi:hypothetical protein